MKMQDDYLGLSPGEFQALAKRYAHFHDTCKNPDEEPVRVFSPLPKKNLEELLLIREVSRDLRKKKEEDMKKAAQVAEEPKEPAEKAEEKAEDTTEDEKKPETEK